MQIQRSLNVGDVVKVRPVHTVTPHDFYVRLTEDDDWIKDFQERTHAREPRPFPGTSLPRTGQLVCLEGPYGWARGMVTLVSDARYSVRMLDYGGVVDGLRVDDIRPLEWGDAPAPKAIHCRLHMCEPKDGNEWNSSSLDTFFDYLGRDPLKMTVMSVMPNGDQLGVELQTKWSNTVSMLMVISGYACFVSCSQQVNRLQPVIPPIVKNHCFVRDHLKLGTEAKVRILNRACDRWYFVKAERYDSYKPLSELLDWEFSALERLDSTEINVGAAIVCKLSSRKKELYFRGEIMGKKVNPEGILEMQIYLVDAGRTVVGPPDEMCVRKCSATLLEEPTFAIECCLNDMQSKNSKLLECLLPDMLVSVIAETYSQVSIVLDSIPKNLEERPDSPNTPE